MKHGLPGKTLAGLTLCIIAGCGPSRTVVLVPDPDGHTGKAEVITDAGSRMLEKPNDMTRVTSPSAPPEPVTTAPADYIATTFADALTIEPLPSEKFILFFDTGTTRLTRASMKSVPAMLAAIKRRDPITITVSGHTDAAGSIPANERLAHERATMIRRLLLDNGVDQERVSLSSHGKRNPIVPTPDGVAEPRNRRVEVIIR